jgi:hypothetical protein
VERKLKREGDEVGSVEEKIKREDEERVRLILLNVGKMARTEVLICESFKLCQCYNSDIGCCKLRGGSIHKEEELLAECRRVQLGLLVVQGPCGIDYVSLQIMEVVSHKVLPETMFPSSLTLT